MATNKRLIKSNDEGGGVATSFNTVLYDGNGTTQSIETVGFAPDLVWIKNRTVAQGHSLWDTVRGASSGYLQSQLTNAEAAAQNMLTFDAEGFNVSTNGGAYTQTNRSSSSDKYVAWCWKAGGAAVTNTDGTTTSQVSANTEAGFSIVGWQSSGSTATVGHGLGVAPNIIIAKKLDSDGGWNFYSSEVGNNKRLFLNDTIGATINDVWGNTDPTNSVFTQGVTATTENVIAYCFAEVAGFSKFGSYTGTGAAGNAQVLGFEPAFLLTKKSSAAGSWHIHDNKRNISNPRLARVFPDKADAESSPSYGVNFYTDSFDFTSGAYNDPGDTYIYMAFANQF